MVIFDSYVKLPEGKDWWEGCQNLFLTHCDELHSGTRSLLQWLRHLSVFLGYIYIYVYTIRIEGVAALFEVPSSLVVVLVVSCQSNWGFASNFLDAGSLTGGWPTVNLYFPFNETETDRNHWRLKTGQICLIGWASVCCDPRWAPVSWPWHVRSMICGKENLRRRIREVLAGLGRWIHPSPWIEVHKKHETTADYFHKMGMHIIYIHYIFICTTIYIYMYLV